MASLIDRRQFVGGAVMTMAAARLGASGSAEPRKREPRELGALSRATEWINSSRLTAADLLGKVVLVDFCTYTCINWLRTLPYIRAWSHQYRPGLVVIGVHTPEFGFEQDLDHVRHALRQMRIEYPIAVDNDYAIWRAFHNNAWPALYFIDASGRVRHQYLGEGEYERSEMVIQRLLADSGASSVRDNVVSVEASGIEVAADWDSLRSPETYVGHDRTVNFASPGGAERDRRRLYAPPKRLPLNHWALAGE
jgi:Thioredoxin like C-terminal domain/AhpC/TSA family